MESIGAFIPIDRRLALSRGEDLPERQAGAVLFADIAGFTPLTEGLARELGPQRGPEDLTRLLNQVYSSLVDAVHRYRGSVVGFGGDAITCWFAGDDGQRAVTCAREIHAAMQPFALVETPAGTRFDLAIKVAIAGGTVRRFVVGDPELRKLDVVVGRVLDRMAEAEHLAERGETVVAAEVASTLGDRLVIGEWRTSQATGDRFAVVRDVATPALPDPWPVLADDAVDETEARRWLWPAVYDRLTRLQGQFLAELRPAVALFLRFGGIDNDDDPAAGSKLDAYVRAVEAVVDRYGGTLLELSFGDKGSHVYAGFGAPVAFVDDAPRAVAAALDLLALSRDWPGIGDVQIGLARGPMRTGAYGSASRATYSVMGDRTNLAARLMVAAGPNGICCDEAVHERASGHWQFEALPAIQVKGKSGWIEVFRPTGEAAPERWQVPGRRGELVGRREELGRLDAALDALAAGGSAMVWVQGEAGIGKSRLAHELMAHATARGWSYLLGAGQSIEQQTPWRAWRDIVSSYFEIEGIADPAGRQHRIERRVEDADPDLLPRLPLLGDILGLDFPETDLTRGLDPALRLESAIELVLTLLRDRAREQPLVLLLDDAHWLDSVSWDMVLHTARGLRAAGVPFLLAIITRPPDPLSLADRQRSALTELGGMALIALDTLAPDEVVALVEARLGLPAGGLPPEVAELVRARSGGNPFYAEELVYALRDRGVIAITADPDRADLPVDRRNRCGVVVDLAEAGRSLPDNIHGLILARIDQMPPERQLLLKVAAVIGRTFTFTPLQHAVSRYVQAVADVLKEHLRRLEAYDLAALEVTEPDLTYVFKHIVTVETAYQTLLFAQRREIHGVVAEWYETTFGAGDAAEANATEASSAAATEASATLAPYYPLLAYHFRQAERIDRERRYAMLTGEHAAAQYANAEALEYLGRALEIADTGDASGRYRLLAARESVLDRLGERTAQAADLWAMAELSARLNRPRWQAEVALRQSNYALVNSDYNAAAESAALCVALAQDAGDLAVATRGLITWGKLEWQRGNFRDARARLDEALALTEATGSRADAAECLLNLGVTERHQLNLDAARRYFESALAIQRALGNRQGEAGCLSTLGAIAGELGEYTLARRYGEQAMAICRLIGYRRGMTIIEGNLASDFTDLGDYDTASQYLENALTLCRELGDRWGEAVCLDTLGLVRHRQGDLRAASDDLDQALAIQRAIDDQHGAGYTLTHLGHLYADAGELPAAIAAHTEALSIREGLDQAALMLDNRAGLAEVALRQRDLAAARDLAESVQAAIAEEGSDGVEFPVLVDWICYQIFRATAAANDRPGDAAIAAAALGRAHGVLQARAEGIQDAELRELYLRNVWFNRVVVEAWAAGAAGAAGAAPAGP